MIRTMISLAIRWFAPMLALFVLGPLAALMVRGLSGPLGGEHFSFLVGPGAAGVVVMLAVVGLALIAGVLGSLIDNPHSGLTSAGLVLCWATWQTGEINGILRATDSRGTLTTLGVEGVIVAVLGIALAWVVLRAGAKKTPPDHVVEHTVPVGDQTLYIGLGVCVLATLVGAYLVAREPLKGQAVAGAIIAGLLGTMAGRLAAPKAPAFGYIVVIGVIAAASPLLASMLAGPEGPLAAARANHLFRPGNILPMDWMAGAFVGAPIGLAWAASMLHKEDPRTAKA